MKKYLPFIFAALVFSCSKGPTPESLAMEKVILNCWNENWSEKKEYDISKGIKLLDEYLDAKGLLGKRTVEDYKKFFNDTVIVYIPDSVKGSDEMEAALNSEYTGAPNIEGMIRCWDANWFKKMKTLDSTDVLCRTGVLVEKLSKSSDSDFHKVLDKFFLDMTQEEFDRPLIKDISYFIFWKTRNQKTHIQFRHPTL